MTLILNDIWEQYNRLIQSSPSTDIDRKINALNIAQKYLIERMYQLGKRIDEFISNPTNTANLIDTNYVSIPSDFLALHKAWYRSGNQFVLFGRSSFLTYDDLLQRTGQNFFLPGSTGTPTIFAVKEPYIYFDTFFDNVYTNSETITGLTSGAVATVSSVSGTTLTYTITSGVFQSGETIEGSLSGTLSVISDITSTTMTISITGGSKEIKISYVKYPSDISYYDELLLSAITGTFQVGETVEGKTSLSTGIITTVNAGSIEIDTIDGVFQVGETIEGITSSATGTLSSISYLSDPLVWGNKYAYILTEAASLIWEHMKGANNVPARSDIVDGLIEMLSTVNRGYEEGTWSTE